MPFSSLSLSCGCLFAKLVIWLSSLSLVPVSCLVSITVPASCLLAYPWTSALSLSREGGNFITSRVERLKNNPCRTRLTQSFLFKCFLKFEIAPILGCQGSFVICTWIHYLLDYCFFRFPLVFQSNRQPSPHWGTLVGAFLIYNQSEWGN